ncbi:hypothetical protein DSECCO2_495630 [anaerobic digester metagenome]
MSDYRGMFRRCNMYHRASCSFRCHIFQHCAQSHMWDVQSGSEYIRCRIRKPCSGCHSMCRCYNTCRRARYSFDCRKYLCSVQFQKWDVLSDEVYRHCHIHISCLNCRNRSLRQRMYCRARNSFHCHIFPHNCQIQMSDE